MASATVELTACFADPQRVQQGDGTACMVDVEFALVINGRSVDTQQRGPITLIPDRLVTVPTVELHEVGEIRARGEHGGYYSSTTPLLMNLGSMTTVVSEVYDGAGRPLSARTVTWTVSPSGVVAVSQQSNGTLRITAVSPGTTELLGNTGGRITRIPLEVQATEVLINGSGLGSGVVTSEPVGIDCRVANGVSTGVCRLVVPRNTTVALYASPSAGSLFVGWSGACTTTSSICTNTSSQARVTVTPQFLTSCTLIVGAIPAAGGVVSLQSGSLTGACGRSVELEARANNGYSFRAWSDGTTTPMTTIVLTQTQQTLNALFDEDQCTLTLSVSPAVGGEAHLVSGTSIGLCGRAVSIRAVPAPGYLFRQWSDGNLNADRSIIVNQRAQSLTALFREPDCTLALSVNVLAGGAASVTSGSLVGECGRTVRVRATPSSGWDFLSWSDENTSAERTVVIDRPTTALVANFAQECTVILSANPLVAGRVSVLAGGATGRCNRSVTILATPTPGYRFVRWSDGSIDPERNLVVSRERVELVAHFEVLPISGLQIVGTGSGDVVLPTLSSVRCQIRDSVTTGSCTHSLPTGTEVALRAEPAQYHNFAGWEGACSGLGECRVIVVGPTLVRARFVRREVPFTFIVNGVLSNCIEDGEYGCVRGWGSLNSGSWSCALERNMATRSCAVRLLEGAYYGFTAVPGPSSSFLGYTGLVTSNNPQLTFQALPNTIGSLTTTFAGFRSRRAQIDSIRQFATSNSSPVPVTIYGRGFLGTTGTGSVAVQIDARGFASNVNILSDTRLSAVFPASTPTPVVSAIRVLTEGAIVASQNCLYCFMWFSSTPGLSPMTGTIQGNTNVVFTGVPYPEGILAIYVNERLAPSPYIRSGEFSIGFRTPIGVSTGPATVRLQYARGSAYCIDCWTYTAAGLAAAIEYRIVPQISGSPGTTSYPDRR